MTGLGWQVDTSSPGEHTKRYANSAQRLDAALNCLRRVDAGADRTDAPSGSGERSDSTLAGADCDGRRALEAYARSQSAVFSEEWLNSLEPRKGGHEHETYVDPSAPEWRIKVTGPDLALLSGRRRLPALTFVMYLESWRLANIVFGDRVEFLGVIVAEEEHRNR